MNDYTAIGFVGLLIALGAGIFRFGRWSQRVDNRLDRLDGRLDRVDGRLDSIEEGLNLLLWMHRQEFLGLYGSGSFDSLTPDLSQTELLLVKLKEDTITHDEAEQLRRLP